MRTNRIRELRKEEGWNQKELGEELKVGQTTISAWETARNEPDTESQHKMAKLFGCSIGYLMGYEQDNGFRGLTKEEWTKHQEKIKEELQRKKDENYNSREELEQEEILSDIEHIETNETWEKAHKQVYYESAAIDRLFEELNLTREERENAVEIIKTALKFRK